MRAAGYVTGHIGKWNLPVDAKECFHEIANQTDPEAATTRFDKWDSDQDGFLSHDEFIHMGAKAK